MDSSADYFLTYWIIWAPEYTKIIKKMSIQVDPFRCFDIQFILIEDKENQKIFTAEKLEQRLSVFYCLMFNITAALMCRLYYYSYCWLV